ncbi:thioester reductase [Streptomyces sp. Tue 6075]|uniref:condensation domain-containing protein n=1 Tax=Streptomyces sp. Tue 6075 TaxID=1661694 RepID=UPI00094A3CA2|nr:condensation domain-containing protein [Streptomyces sp. Tue 6075]APS20770.1 thioester reductase [Streptomyces sp. Tue 6075]
MTASGTRAAQGPTSLAEMARLTGEFADWHNLHYMAMWLTGELDVAALRDAWWRVCLRHDALRRTYLSPEEARTDGDALSEVEFHTAASDADAVELMRRFIGRPFDLGGPSFSRVAVVRCGERRHLFGIAIDHIINDLASWALIRADFTEFYRRALTGDSGDVTAAGSYQSFASEERRLFAGGWGKECRAFWRSYVDEFGTVPAPFPVGGDTTGAYRPRTISRVLPADAKSRLHALSLEARATPFAAVTAGVLAAAKEVTGDPVAGISVNQHGRMLPGTSQTAGLFVQTVPLHLKTPHKSPAEAAREVFHRTHDVFEYSVPLLVAGRYWSETLMAPDRQAGLYVSLNEAPPSSHDLPPFAGTEAEYVELDVPGGKRFLETVVVAWNLYETGPELVAHYNEDRFPGEAVEQLLEAAERFVLPADAR